MAMPRQPEPTEAASPGKTAIVNVAKARAEKKRKEEEMENELAKGFDEHFGELLEYEHDIDGNQNTFVPRARLEEWVIQRAEEKGIHILR